MYDSRQLVMLRGDSARQIPSVRALVRAILVAGANREQGLALCQRILQEHDDTPVFLHSRHIKRGKRTVASTLSAFQDHADIVQLDVMDSARIQVATLLVKDKPQEKSGSCSLKSNAGILWKHFIPRLLDVCIVGVQNVVDAVLPSWIRMQDAAGRLLGFRPTMLGHAHREHLKVHSSWTRQDGAPMC